MSLKALLVSYEAGNNISIFMRMKSSMEKFAFRWLKYVQLSSFVLLMKFSNLKLRSSPLLAVQFFFSDKASIFSVTSIFYFDSAICGFNE